MAVTRPRAIGTEDNESGRNGRRCCPAAGGQLVVAAVDGKLSIG